MTTGAAEAQGSRFMSYECLTFWLTYGSTKPVFPPIRSKRSRGLTRNSGSLVTTGTFLKDGCQGESVGIMKWHDR
jgi:hypothetical protein